MHEDAIVQYFKMLVSTDYRDVQNTVLVYYLLQLTFRRDPGRYDQEIRLGKKDFGEEGERGA